MPNRLHKLGSRKSAQWMKKHKAKLWHQHLVEFNARFMQLIPVKLDA